MIQNESLSRMPIDQSNRLFQLALVNQNVVRQTALTQLRNAAIEIRPIHIAIRLSLNNLSKTYQLVATREPVEFSDKVVFGKRRPTNDPTNCERCVSTTQKPIRLIQRLSRLHHNRRINASFAYHTKQIRHKEVSPQQRHLIANPGKLRFVISPQMMMRINPWRTGAWLGHRRGLQGFGHKKRETLRRLQNDIRILRRIACPNQTNRTRNAPLEINVYLKSNRRQQLRETLHSLC